MYGVARDGPFALGNSGERAEVGGESAAAHGAFFLNTVLALGEDVGVAFAGQEFDSHFGTRLLPFAVEQFGFQRGELSFGRADEVAHRRIALMHLLEHFFGRDTSVHDPDAVGLSVLRFDFCEEGF